MLPTTRNNSNSAFAPFATNPINRLDALFDQFLAPDGGQVRRAWSGTTPVAVWQDDDMIFVEAETPGVSENDIEVTVHDGMLYIRGERKPEEGRQWLYNGRSYGRFEQTIALPHAVSADNVRATLTNGVLHIALPKSPEAKPKKIAVKAS